MALSRTTLAKISAYNSTWLHRGKFTESSDGGALYIQGHHYLADTVINFFAISKSNEELSVEKVDELSHFRTLFVVIPYYKVSPEIFSMLGSIESSWLKNKTDVDTDNPKYALREQFQIDVVGDRGKDSATGQTRYYCVNFLWSPFLAEKLTWELVKQGKKTHLDPYSLPASEMKAALKGFLLRFYKEASWAATLTQVNEAIRNANRAAIERNIEGRLHFEELEQKGVVSETILDLLMKGLSRDEVRSKTIVAHGIASCDILDEWITELERLTPENREELKKYISTKKR